MTRPHHLERSIPSTKHNYVSVAIAVVFLGGIALVFYLARAGDTSNWPHVDGRIVGSRAKPRPPAEITARSGHGQTLMYAAEFKVMYRVGTGEFSIWTDGGCVSEDRASVEKRAEDLAQTRKAIVWYKPTNPTEAFGSIIGDTRC